MYNNIYIYKRIIIIAIAKWKGKKKKKTCEDKSTKETRVFKLLNFKIMISNQNCQYRWEITNYPKSLNF